MSRTVENHRKLPVLHVTLCRCLPCSVSLVLTRRNGAIFEGIICKTAGGTSPHSSAKEEHFPSVIAPILSWAVRTSELRYR
jgi:hypothetical protein